MTKGVRLLLVEACVILLLGLAWGPEALAWDPLGHGLAAATGARLIHDTPFRKLLLEHEGLLRASAAFPDVPFRKLSTEIAGYEAEAPNHFFHLDDPKVQPIFPRFLHASCSAATELLGREATRTGVSPWRAEQFEKLARADFTAGNPVDAVYHLGLGSHMIADHAIPWHSKVDAHGAANGHSNIHIFLEGCTDSFLKEGGERYDPEFAKSLEDLARKRRADLLVFLERDTGSSVTLSLRGLEEGGSNALDFERLDTDDTFVSGHAPKPGTPKDSTDAARKGEACLKFKHPLQKRLATAAAYVSMYFDLLQRAYRPTQYKRLPPRRPEGGVEALSAYKGGAEIPPSKPNEAKEYEGKPYPWFECR